MKDKKLHSRIFGSPLALQYPEMAAACVRTGVNEAGFIAVHKHMTGELPAASEDDDNEDDDGDATDDMVNQLHAMPE
ncbi:hypothetical protein D4M60_07830 [Klebsiella pneumoniae]|uniref:hypothetical protein n=1 Tax=Klebsiella pneumoniae TaxID=573 RepID=UPI0011DC83F4|nr:hypothetical protein [Klebsiella pneumoniae]EKZ5694342.1 hypothetical protein [Klebsiella quasipneumoniae]DAF19279.1 MAG TPA: hypothetical protein [Bacteriophage sp.]HBX9954301.1 hypothetical protein [Klebsiella variicola]EMB2528814.1 hypothetical protein [Klebsiella pneumoniae]EME9720123.1 hypothetical protein [Klebsiella pneumoniae]